VAGRGGIEPPAKGLGDPSIAAHYKALQANNIKRITSLCRRGMAGQNIYACEAYSGKAMRVALVIQGDEIFLQLVIIHRQQIETGHSSSYSVIADLLN